MKNNNMRLIMGKSMNELFDNSLENLEEYCAKFELDLEEVERSFCKLLAFENNKQQKGIVYFMGIIPPYVDMRCWNNKKWGAYNEELGSRHDRAALQREGEGDSINFNQEMIKKRAANKSDAVEMLVPADDKAEDMPPTQPDTTNQNKVGY